MRPLRKGSGRERTRSRLIGEERAEKRAERRAIGLRRLVTVMGSSLPLVPFFASLFVSLFIILSVPTVSTGGGFTRYYGML